MALLETMTGYVSHFSIYVSKKFVLTSLVVGQDGDMPKAFGVIFVTERKENFWFPDKQIRLSMTLKNNRASCSFVTI